LGIPIAGGALAWLAGCVRESAAKWTALLSSTAYLVAIAMLWHAGVLAAFDSPWIAPLGIRFELMADGMGSLLLTLTGVVSLVAVAVSWRSVARLAGAHYLALLWTVAGITGAFMAMDLILFVFFLELMLIPLYFLIAVWGREKRRYAAIKFIICTQAGSLALLVGILGLSFAHFRLPGDWTFDYFALLQIPLSPVLRFWLMLAFFAGFAVKLPVFGLHGWLPDAHAEAPVAGSVLLAGLALKVGAYGFMRFLIPLFPEAISRAGPLVMALGVAGIIFGAWQAYGQRDLKRLIAYTSISHMGYVLLGIFSWTELGLQGAMIGILAHGVGTSALFGMAGMLHERMGTYDLERMGGLWQRMPRLGGATLVLAMASLGLPGLANFVGEFLVLVGAWQVHPALAAAASLGLVFSVIYAMKLVEKIFHGPLMADAGNSHDDAPNIAGCDGAHASKQINNGFGMFGGRRAVGAGHHENCRIDAGLMPDAGLREFGVLAGCIAILVWMGLNPGPLLQTGEDSLNKLRHGIISAPAAPNPAGAADAVPSKNAEPVFVSTGGMRAAASGGVRHLIMSVAAPDRQRGPP